MHSTLFSTPHTCFLDEFSFYRSGPPHKPPTEAFVGVGSVGVHILIGGTNVAYAMWTNHRVLL